VSLSFIFGVDAGIRHRVGGTRERVCFVCPLGAQMSSRTDLDVFP